MIRLALIPGLVAALATVVCPAAEVSVTGVRFWTLDGMTRVAIELDGDFRYRSDKLQNPERLFFDILGARKSIGGSGVYAIPVDDPQLKRIRVAQSMPDMTRVVLDLEGSPVQTVSMLTNPSRLMVELRNKTAPPFQAPPKLKPTPLPSATPMTKVEPPRKAESPAATASSALPIDPGLPSALPARRSSGGGNTMIRALGLKIGRVVLDPGHGGHDQGSTGPGGLLEKELVLDVAKRLGVLIEEQMGSEVIFTREDDTFISLESRPELANQKKADLFLSIHANSSPYQSVSGMETYHLNLTTSREALDLAARENAGSRRSIHDLSDLIQKITMNEKAAESREFAAKMQTSLHTFAAKNVGAVKNRGVKKAPFVVLVGATMPAILAEIGFVSNPKEEALMKKSEHRQRLAEALYRGVARYAETLSHFQVAAVKD